ncbi:substrate-binding domain-containing protein [Actinomadura rudentiformis]|uniref:VWA domain-containing protein n=1 Tax=Actinomadura rudentiformis TaxID=359158 RepID=A0A6H9Z399_9ACTN|nr:substrate-binding domain-containing protein [Actinomadura rudentiformis]KAB2348917.1 VWA domain-containing protein [Actinomadura rudentiformis]
MSERGDVPEWLPRDSPRQARGPALQPPPPSWRPQDSPAPEATRSPRHGRDSGGGSHALPPRPRRGRGLLIGPLAGAIGLTLLAAFGVYAFASGSGCGGDDAVTLNVAAEPGVAPAVTAAAGRLNDANDTVSGRCVRAEVTVTEPVAVATLLSGRGVAGVTRRPDVWIPDSSLWIGPAQAASRSTGQTRITPLGSLAASPLVVAAPRTLAAQLKGQGTQPSWADLLKAASGSAAAPGNAAIPAGLVKLQVPDPNRTGPGMATLLLANALQARSPKGTASFTGVARAVREGVSPSVKAGFASFRRDRQGRYPVALAPEQAVHEYNVRGPGEPAVALYPSEGTLTMDHPVLVLGQDGVRERASRLLTSALTARPTQDDLRERGFRTPGGVAPGSFSEKTGLDPRPPRVLPPPAPTEVQRTMQAWARLSLSIRMLSIIDVSGSMEDEVAPGITRLQSTVRTAQQGLALLPDDTELGQWVFSTDLQNGQDWRELVGVGPLGERLGSATRRQLILSAFAQIRPKENGDTGLYDTILAAYRTMKRSYKPEFVNSVLLWTDGKNDDPGGPSLRATLDALRREVDPERPVLVFMYGYGKGVDAGALRQIAEATRGDVLIADTPDEVQQKFLQAVARRVCAPDC